jgi:hypothetical protein
MRPRFPVLAALALTGLAAAALTASAAAAQATAPAKAHADSASRRGSAADSTDDDDDGSDSRFTYGVSGRTSTFQDGHAEYGGGMVLTFAPAGWVSLAMNPSYAIATNPKRTATVGRFNLSSVPVEVDGSHQFAGILHPELGVSLGAEFPVATADSGATSHRPSYSADVALGITPIPHLHLNGDASRDLDPSAARTLFDAGSATSVSAGVSVDAGHRLTVGMGFSGDVGTAAPGDTLTRSIGGSAAFALAGPLSLTIDGSHRVQGNSPDWSVSVGIGTAFAGVATIGPASALSRIRHAARALHGRGKA